MELLPLMLILAVMVLPLLWMSSRQRKLQQKQMEMVNSLGIGDEVRTHSGFFGLIVDEFDDVVILESESGAQTKWARAAIAMKVENNLDAAAAELLAEGSETPADASETEGGRDGRGTDVPGVTMDDDTRDDRRDR